MVTFCFFHRQHNRCGINWYKLSQCQFALGRQEEESTNIMQQLLTNEHLFELMLPYISPDESGLDADTSSDE